MSACRSCGAEIEWITLNGHPHPINCDPDATGNIVYADGIDGKVGLVLTNEQRDERIRSGRHSYGPDGGPGIYKSHFATCPQAPTWRKQAREHVERDAKQERMRRRYRGQA